MDPEDNGIPEGNEDYDNQDGEDLNQDNDPNEGNYEN
jgi:hypothetical protein